MLELEVMPERALATSQWELVLGMPLSQALEILQLHSRVVRTAQLTYSEQRPFEQDLSVDLNQDGVRLYFDPKSQRLKLIEVYDVTKVKLKYCNKHFCSPETTPTVDQINHSFGPTHPGEMDKGRNYYLLHFRGILFAFPLWSAQSGYSPSPELGELLEADSYGSLVLSRLCLFSGNITDPADARAPKLPLECFHGNGYTDSVEVVRNEDGIIEGLYLKVLMDDPRPSQSGEGRPRLLERQVLFGDTPQDVATSLGAPSKVFFKAEDKMRIHSSASHKLPTSKCSDYFFNYFTLGLDILFDCTTHRVRKMVMHNNVPGHYNFNIYNRCEFIVKFPASQQLCRDSSSSDVVVTTSTKWSEIQDYLTEPTDKPVVLNRSSSTNSINPFGSTFCYGHQNVIFEVMRNQHIASITIYSTRTRK